MVVLATNNEHDSRSLGLLVEFLAVLPDGPDVDVEAEHVGARPLAGLHGNLQRRHAADAGAIGIEANVAASHAVQHGDSLGRSAVLQDDLPTGGPGGVT